MPRKHAAPTRWPWETVDLPPHEISALKAVAQQHPVAFAVLIEKLCGVSRMSFTAGGEDGRRATDFAEGKRWVGKTLLFIRDVELPAQPTSKPK